MATKNAEHIIRFEPNSEIFFKGPYTEPSRASLKLSNLTAQLVVYKIKTTAPKKYSVRPTHGVIGPRSSANIVIILRRTDLPSLKSRNKFLIQYAFGPLGDNGNPPMGFNVQQFWRQSKIDKSYEQKLRCVFDFSQSTKKKEDSSSSSSGAEQSGKELSAKSYSDETSASNKRPKLGQSLTAQSTAPAAETAAPTAKELATGTLYKSSPPKKPSILAHAGNKAPSTPTFVSTIKSDISTTCTANTAMSMNENVSEGPSNRNAIYALLLAILVGMLVTYFSMGGTIPI